MEEHIREFVEVNGEAEGEILEDAVERVRASRASLLDS